MLLLGTLRMDIFHNCSFRILIRTTKILFLYPSLLANMWYMCLAANKKTTLLILITKSVLNGSISPQNKVKACVLLPVPKGITAQDTADQQVTRRLQQVISGLNGLLKKDLEPFGFTGKGIPPKTSFYSKDGMVQ